MEAWVTTVTEDKQTIKSLVLARSLRKAMTTRKLIVIASPSINSNNRSLLGTAYDQLIFLDQNSVNGWIKLEEFAKLYGFTLTLFRKCVYLAPGTLVVKNCDEIFDSEKEFRAWVTRAENGAVEMDMSVLCYTPSMKIFEHLVETGKRIAKTDVAPFESYLKNWLLNQKSFEALDEKFNFELNTDMIAAREFSIANLTKIAKSEILDELCFDGILESAALNYWKALESDITPSIDGGLNTSPNSAEFQAKDTELLDAIAIVGISFRHPGANNMDEFWDMLINGRSGVRTVPEGRWNKEHGVHNTSASDTLGGFLSQSVDEFDGKLFGISPKELEFLDPQQRLLLEVTWEALENASIDPLSLKGTHAGVFLGAWMNDYKDIIAKNGCEEFYRIYMGNSFGAAAARLSFFLGLTGPSIATESGCSSAMVAVDLAIKSLRRGDTNLALACGVNLLLNPFNKDTMSHVLSADGMCKTFDESADGFTRAEGCGVLVLKKYTEAVRDGDKVWALIRGSSCVQEGLSRSMGTPTKDVEAMAMRLALRNAAVKPEQVSFLEAHGTGTPVGDPLEISAIAEVYGSRKRNEPLIIGSVKTNVGHTESCSGITGIIKVVASLQNETIPPHLNLKKLNPKINLESIPAKIPLEAMPWPRINGKSRMAGVSSFGITGTDGHLIVQDAPADGTHQNEFFVLAKKQIQERPLHLLKLSARTEEALENIIGQYQNFLVDSKSNELSFSDLCYSANIGRASFSHRAVLLAKDKKECLKLLQTRKYMKGEVPESIPSGKLCFLFTGQGAQYEEMAKQLYESSPVFRMNFDKCNAILNKKYGIDVKGAVWNPKSRMDIKQTLFSQTSIFCVEYGLLKLWESWGFKPDYVIGHSLGEFCAAVAAKILTLEDAIMLVAERSKLVEALPKAKMLVLKAPKREVEQALRAYSEERNKPGKFWLDIAAVNSSEQTVLAGDSANVEDFSRFCSEVKKLKTHILDSSHAFHSRLMDPILDNYKNVAESIRKNCKSSEDFKGFPKYISGVYGRLIENGESDMLTTSQYWVDHTREKVEFIGACEAIMKEGCTHFLEVGPQPILSALVMANSKNQGLICLPSLRRNEDNWKTILSSLARLYLQGWNVDWNGFDKLYSREKLHCLPTYPFQRKKYWFDVQSSGVGTSLLNSAKIHPLLGSIFPNASGAKIFQNGLDIRKKVDWIKDHCIGKRVIFPGAGFLEMSLASGHCVTEGLTESFCKPSGPLTIENMKILAPLALEENQVCQLQVVLGNVAEKKDEEEAQGEGVKVEIFRQHFMEGEAPKWTRHCVSYFTPSPVDYDEIRFREQFNFEKLKEECATQLETQLELYERLAEVGLKFGSSFQSLEKMWKGEEGIMAQTKVPKDWKDYIVHPTLLDAMLQTAMVVQSRGKIEKLHVPIGIKKLTWLEHDQNTEDAKFFIYSCFVEQSSSENENEKGHAQKDIISVLFDGNNGKIIAFIAGMEFAETSVQAMETHLELQETNLPALHHEVWKPLMGPNQLRINIWEVFKEEMFDPEQVCALFKDSNVVEDRILEREPVYEALVYAYTLNAYYELGWSPKVGQNFILDKFMFDYQISPQHRKLVRYHMTMLEREGVVKFISDSELEIIRLPPSLLEVHQMIQKARRKLESFDNVENTVQIYTSCGQNLAPILQGKSSALSILFPQDPSKPSAESFYTEAYSYSGIDIKTRNHFKLLMNPIDPNSKAIFRVLEVGAGTGNFTGGILNMLKEQGIQVEYTFTDISSAFFLSAAKKFEEHKESLKYRVFNVEDDAKSQGFSPGYYDAIFAADVLHATKDLSDSLSNLRQLLRPNGLLTLIEGAKQNHITCIFGLLEGYWRFVDTNVRQHHPLVSGETWRDLCLNLGFDKAVQIPCSNNFYTFVLARATSIEPKINRPITFSNGSKWLVFPNLENESKYIVHRLSLYRPTITVWKSVTFQERDDGMAYGINVNKKEHMTKLFASIKSKSCTSHIEGIIYLWGMSVGNSDQADISQPFLHMCQAVVEMKQQQIPKIFLMTKGVYSIGDHLCQNPGSSTVWGIAKSCSNEMNMKIKLIDLCPEAQSSEETYENSQDAFYELWHDSLDSCIAYRQRTKYFGRLMKTKLTEKPLKLPQSSRFHLILPQSKAISDLKFGTLGKYVLKPKDIEVQVKSAALNFRDVFAVMKPDPQFDKINVVGSDFAGVVSQVGSEVTKWKAGDHVFGCNLEDGALPSHVKIPEDAVVSIPKNFTFPEAATLPAVFATAYYSLVTIAKMKEGDTVLVHTASGGVGLSAIQICQGIGARVIATAGSARKRAYLRSLGVKHVFHSRNTKYEQGILKVTKGKGVDIVLNSLTGPGFKEASLNVCKKNARFVEMSKLSIWQPEEVKELRPDVEYTIVDLTSVSREVWADLFETLDAFLKQGMVKPIPYVRFDGVHIREALTYLQKAKHIGKIVCIMPEISINSGQLENFTPLFNEESTYLITGGLGGIGFEVCKWMASQGAKHLVIVNRSQPKEKHLQILRQLRAQNKNIITKSADVGDYAICKNLIESLNDPSLNLPPLRGIMHAAGVLSDATLINQSWDKFLSTYRPKIKGAWNLHELTQNCNLEHFVMFSSMAALFGPPGQSNHAAGNAYLDALAWYRETIGLPATTVNWGQWGQVGVAAGREVRGVLPFSPQRGIAALEATMKSQRTQICVVDLDIPVLMKVQPQSKAYMQDMAGSASSDSVVISIKSEKFWEEVDSAKDDEKPKIIKEYIKVLLRQILKLDDEEPIDDHSNFQDMGLDSLMMIELKNNLQTVLGTRMTVGASALADCHNIELLSERLIHQMNEHQSIPGIDSGRKLSVGELRHLVENDSKLPEEIRPAHPPPKPISHAKVFLITGVTGNLGPYILQELLQKHSGVEVVYCLLRKSANPEQRLNQILKETILDSKIDLSRVKPVIGDITSEKFGMEEDKWNSLSDEVDVVIHCAVKSNHVENYGLNPMRTINVYGTQRVLEFCCYRKTKYLFHSSSIVAVSSTDEDGCLSQDWPLNDELEGVTDLGYPTSKMICDRLVHQAVERGLPAKSFRFGGLIGHSETGRFKHHNNHIMLRFLCYMKLGAMPSVPIPSFLLPVDIAASTAIRLFFADGEFKPDILNVIHPYPALEQEFPLLAKEFGYDVDVVDYTEFVNRFSSEGEDSLLYPFRELYENEERYNSLATFPDAIRKWLENPDNFFKVQKVIDIIPDYAERLEQTWDYVRRDLLFAKSTGLFDKFRLKK